MTIALAFLASPIEAQGMTTLEADPEILAALEKKAL